MLALLVESAVLATDRGMVQIRAQRLPESTDPGHLLFTVSDTGSGMPPLERSTLALVRTWELVGPDGELVSLESGPKGTTVSFSMRLAAHVEQQPVPAAPEPDKETLSRLPASSLRIIVASSVPANRQMLSYYLDELPHEIIEARSAGEAKALYRRTPGALIIFDDDMPEESIAEAVASIRIFEGEHNFPLASILALAGSDEQIDALRRAGCTHFLKKPITRKDLRVLTLRLAPVSRRFKDTGGASPKPAPKPQAAAPKSPPRVSPDIPNLPEFPEPAKPLPALSTDGNSHAAEPAPAKKGLFASLFAPFRKQAKPAAPETPAVAAPVDEPVMTLTEKAPEKPIKLSSVGEPMPISKAPSEEAPAPKTRPERPNPLEERAKHMPAQPSAPKDAAEWVGEPMPIIKKKDGDQKTALQVEAPLEMPTQEKEAEKRPDSEHDSVPRRSETPAPLNAMPALDLDEWVGEPTPITKPLTLSDPLTASGEAPLTLEPKQAASPQKRDSAPLTLDPADEEPLTLTAQADKEEPLMLGTPLPDGKPSLSNDALMLDEPLGNRRELPLTGLELEPQVINLTEPVRTPPADSLRRRAFPICLGLPGQPNTQARVRCWMKRPVSPPVNKAPARRQTRAGWPLTILWNSAHRWIRPPSRSPKKAPPSPNLRRHPSHPCFRQKTAKRLRRSSPQPLPKHRDKTPPFPLRTDGTPRPSTRNRKARHRTKPSAPCSRNLMKLWSAPSKANNRATRKWSVKPPPISGALPKPMICACWTIRPAALKRSPAPAIWTKSRSSCRIWFPPSTGIGFPLKKRSGKDKTATHSKANTF